MKKDNGAANPDPREAQEQLGIPAGAPQPLLTLPEVCRILRISPKTLQRRIGAGDLVVVRDGRRVLVTSRDLACYVAARRSL